MAIIKCDCTGFMGGTAAAQYQDEKYGKGRRVGNPLKGSGKDGKDIVKQYRCTVCGETRGKG